jgi:hypothetical protein
MGVAVDGATSVVAAGIHGNITNDTISNTCSAHVPSARAMRLR